VALAAEEFDTALHIIGEVIQHSTLDEEELNRERQVILEEYYRKQDDPQGVLWENLYERMFARGPYKAPVLGLPETLEAIGRPQMLDYYERHYAPANMALLIVGNVDPDAALRKVEEQMGAFERPFRPLLDRNALTTDYARQVEHVIEKDVNETYCALAFPAPALRDAREAYAIDVMQFVLGGGHASLLYQEVKEKRQLATSIGAGYPSSRFDDIFYIYATCQEDKRREMEAAVSRRWDRQNSRRRRREPREAVRG
jgi:zinc protease